MMLKNKYFLFNLRSLTTFSMVVYFAYYLLLCDNCFHSSISSIIEFANHLNLKQHLLVLGLLPIYISAMIFGAISLGIFFASRLEYLLQKKSPLLSK